MSWRSIEQIHALCRWLESSPETMGCLSAPSRPHPESASTSRSSNLLPWVRIHASWRPEISWLGRCEWAHARWLRCYPALASPLDHDAWEQRVVDRGGAVLHRVFEDVSPGLQEQFLRRMMPRDVSASDRPQPTLLSAPARRHLLTWCLDRFPAGTETRVVLRGVGVFHMVYTARTWREAYDHIHRVPRSWGLDPCVPHKTA